MLNEKLCRSAVLCSVIRTIDTQVCHRYSEAEKTLQHVLLTMALRDDCGDIVDHAHRPTSSSLPSSFPPSASFSFMSFISSLSLSFLTPLFSSPFERLAVSPRFLSLSRSSLSVGPRGSCARASTERVFQPVYCPLQLCRIGFFSLREKERAQRPCQPIHFVYL